jgi:predicted DNA-binding WGR domain protein
MVLLRRAAMNQDIQPWIRLRWEKSTRYYEAHLHPDLWGEWILTVRWGRRGTRLGQGRDRPCASYAEGMARLAAVGMRRAQRGYRPSSII